MKRAKAGRHPHLHPRRRQKQVSHSKNWKGLWRQLLLPAGRLTLGSPSGVLIMPSKGAIWRPPDVAYRNRLRIIRHSA